MECIFCQIVAGKVPAQKIHEDDLSIAIRDIRPQAPTHVLVMPRVHVASMGETLDERLAGRLFLVAAEIARREKLDKGWRLIVNTGEHGGQEVPHLHLHVIGGRKLGRMLPTS
jgi:histidine triad (HIT) family protein